MFNDEHLQEPPNTEPRHFNSFPVGLGLTEVTRNKEIDGKWRKLTG